MGRFDFIVGPQKDYVGGAKSRSTGGTSINVSSISRAAAEFMQEWRENLGESQRLYADTESSINDYGKYEGKLGEEYDLLEERFGGLRDQLIETSEEDLTKRNELGGMFMDAATADYEGASSKAVGDVANQAQRGREMQTREDLARGLDPNSSASRISKSKTYLDEAIGKVLAANAARNNEKLRVGSMAAQGMQLFDPNNTANLALGIQNTQTGVRTAQSGVAQNVATMKGNLANSFTQNITSPAADSAGALTGYAVGMSGNDGGSSSRKTTTTTHGGVLNPGFWDDTTSIPASNNKSTIQYGTRDS